MFYSETSLEFQQTTRRYIRGYLFIISALRTSNPTFSHDSRCAGRGSNLASLCYSSLGSATAWDKLLGLPWYKAHCNNFFQFFSRSKTCCWSERRLSSRHRVTRSAVDTQKGNVSRFPQVPVFRRNWWYSFPWQSFSPYESKHVALFCSYPLSPLVYPALSPLQRR
jgi:hypothetical protein